MTDQPESNVNRGWSLIAALVGVAALAMSMLASSAVPDAADAAPGAKVLGKQKKPQKKANNRLVPKPLPNKVRKQRGPFRNCQVSFAPTKHPKCVVVKGPKKRTVVAFGDSKMGQWSSAFKQIAQRNNWRLVWLVKSGCGPASVRAMNPNINNGGEYRQCYEWRRRAMKRIGRLKPAMVLVSLTNGYSPLTPQGVMIEDARERRDFMTDAMEQSLRDLKKVSGRVAVIEDLPTPFRSGIDPVRCVRDRPNNLRKCGFDPKKPKRGTLAHSQVAFDLRAARRVPGVRIVKTTGLFCPKGFCRAVVGDVIAWRDQTHVTPHYARTLVPKLERRLPKPKAR